MPELPVGILFPANGFRHLVWMFRVMLLDQPQPPPHSPLVAKTHLQQIRIRPHNPGIRLLMHNLHHTAPLPLAHHPALLPHPRLHLPRPLQVGHGGIVPFYGTCKAGPVSPIIGQRFSEGIADGFLA